MLDRLIMRLVVLLTIALVAGCGGKSSPTSSIGQFVDEPVAGLGYQCGALTGVTSPTGQFSYNPGDTCTFTVGNVTVGTLAAIPADGKVTPQDAAGVPRSAASDGSTVLAQFLQSLNDGSSAGTINISSATTTALKNVAPVSLISNGTAIDQGSLNTLVTGVPLAPNVTASLVSPTTAQTNLTTQIANAGVNTSVGAASNVTLQSLRVSSTLTSNAAGLSEQLTATGLYSNNTSSGMTNSVSWSSSDATVIAVSSTGLATGLKAGQATITATQGGVSASIALTVTPAQLTSLAVTPATASIAAGLTQQMVLTGTYSDGTSKALAAGIAWSSGSTGVATIDAGTGLATAVSAGSSVVSATVGALSASARLTVTAAALRSITVSATSVSQPAGITDQLLALGNYTDGTSRDISPSVSWSANANGAVTTTGIFTGSAVGTSVVSASLSGVTSNALSISVTAAVLRSISLTPSATSLAAGVSGTLSATGSYSDGQSRVLAAATGVAFSSSNPTVATIDVSSGAIATLSPGTTTLTATLGGVSQSVSLTVTPKALVSLAVTLAQGGSATVPAGLTQALVATGTYTDNSTAVLTGSATWTSSATGIATVSAGVVTGAAAGSATITASLGSGNATISGSLAITGAAAQVTAISLGVPAASEPAGLTEQLTATASWSAGAQTDVTSSATWQSSNIAVATVNAGLLTAVAQGTATITATLNGQSRTTTVTVTAPTLQTLSISGTTTVAAGLSTTLSVTGNYSNGTHASITGASLSWASSNTNVATVLPTGVATGVAQGTATLTASVTSNGSTVTRTAALTVTAPQLVSIAVSAASSNDTLGSTDQLTATGTYTDNSTANLTSVVTWQASAGATVSAAGLLTGTSVGAVTVTASYGGVTSPNATVTVVSVNQISGTAAGGAAMPSAAITVSCTGVSPVTTTAASDGTYSVTLPSGAQAPCLISASLTDATGATQTYYSAVPTNVAGAATANITPISTLVVANAIGSVPSGSTSLSSVSGSLSGQQLSSATSNVVNGLSTSLGVSAQALASPITGALVAAAADSGAPTNAADGAIDQVMASLNIGSTRLSTLASAVAGAGSNVGSTVAGIASTNGLPTSAAAGCPFANSGVYATANVGASNLRNGTPGFGMIRLDFSTMTAVNGGGDNFTITQANPDNPCQFLVQSPSGKTINFQISRAGFVVATSFAPPASTSATASLAVAGTGANCFLPNSGCSGFQLGFPVQTGVTVNDLVGTWQSVEWDLDQYTWGGSLPCQGTKLANGICSLFVSYFRQFAVATPSGGAAGMAVYDCDGLNQGGNSNPCSTTPEGNTALSLVPCATRGDCPTAGAMGQSALGNITLSSVMDVVAGGTTVVGHVLVFRAPNNDLIGFFVAGPGGPTTSDPSHSGIFNNLLFQEQFGVIYRPASNAVLPPSGTVIHNPQWTMVDYNSSINTATIVGQTMSAVTLAAGTNALAVGQVLSNNNNLVAGTLITSVNGNGTYGLSCSDANGNALGDCRVSQATSSFSGLLATSEQVKEQSQVYTTGLTASAGIITRSFSDTIDQGLVDRVAMDTPYRGMTWRAYVPASGNVTRANESVSVRGAGWSIAAGTATVAQQVGGLQAIWNGSLRNYANGCSMPGMVFTPTGIASGTCDSTNMSTGKFFTVNLKY